MQRDLGVEEDLGLDSVISGGLFQPKFQGTPREKKELGEMGLGPSN